MDLLIAALVGGVIGWLLGRAGATRKPANGGATPPAMDRLSRGLSRRQQQIVASLPPDEPRPTIDDLISEEAEELGIPEIAADPAIPLSVRLQVYRRDATAIDVSDPSRLEFELATGATPPIEPSHVRLVVRTEEQ